MTLLVAAVLLIGATVGSLTPRRSAPNHKGGRDRFLPAALGGGGADYGSYIALCNATHLTFLNFAAQSCQGSNYTEFSSPLNVCALEHIPIINRNFSWNAVCNATNAVYSNFDALNCTEPLLLRTYNLGACYECPNEFCKDSVVPPANKFGVLEGEQPWFENQWHTNRGEAFVTSMNNGSVFKISYNASGDCWNEQNCAAVIQPWISQFESVSGIVYSNQYQMFYAIAVAGPPEEFNMIIQFWPSMSGEFGTVATIPPAMNLFGNYSLNGLAISTLNPNIFFATNLGNFTEGMGSVLSINVTDSSNPIVIPFATNLTAADGCFALNTTLYVSEVFAARVHVFNFSNPDSVPVKMGSYVVPGLRSLDDFFVATVNGVDTIYGADWSQGMVASWAADGSSPASFTVHAAGLVHPTSVRPEVDADGVWRNGYVTVTQGGGFPPTGRGANGGAFYRLRVQ